MQIKYYFSDDCHVVVSLKEDNYGSQNYVWIDLSAPIIDFLNDNSNILTATAIGISDEEKTRLFRKLCDLLDDPYNTVYIPVSSVIP